MQTVVNSCFTSEVPPWQDPSPELVVDTFAVFTVSVGIIKDYDFSLTIEKANTVEDVENIIQTATTKELITDANGAIDEEKIKALYLVLFKQADTKQRSAVAGHILTKAPTLISSYFNAIHGPANTTMPTLVIAPWVHQAAGNYAVFMEFVKRGADIYARSSLGFTTLQACISSKLIHNKYSVNYTITQWLLRHNVPITAVPPPPPIEDGQVKFIERDCVQSVAEKYFVEQSLKKMLAEDMFLHGTLAPAILPTHLRTYIWSFLTGIDIIKEKSYFIFKSTSAPYIEEIKHLIALRNQERKALFDVLPEHPG